MWDPLYLLYLELIAYNNYLNTWLWLYICWLPYSGLSSEYLSMLIKALQVVNESCQLPSFVPSHNDLLIDITLLLWEEVKPIFNKLHSHQYSVCRQFLTHEKWMQVYIHVQVPTDISVDIFFYSTTVPYLYLFLNHLLFAYPFTSLFFNYQFYTVALVLHFAEGNGTHLWYLGDLETGCWTSWTDLLEAGLFARGWGQHHSWQGYIQRRCHDHCAT